MTTAMQKTGHDTLSCPDVPKFNLTVLKDTITAEQADDMTEAELHDAVGMTIARGVAAYRSFCNLMTEIKRRLNDGEIVGGCTTLKSYVETWVMLPDESFDTAIRKVYRAIAGEEKDARRTGRPASGKPTRRQLEHDLKNARLAAHAQPPDKASDLALVAAQENAFVAGVKAGREAENQAAAKKKEAVNLQATKAQEVADLICKKIFATVGADDFKKLHGTLRTSSKRYLKLRGISVTEADKPEPPTPTEKKSAKQIAEETTSALKNEPSQAKPTEPLNFVTDGSLTIGHTYSEDSKGTASEIEFVTPKQHAALTRRHGVV